MKRPALDRRTLLTLLILPVLLLGIWAAVAMSGRWQKKAERPEATDAMGAFLWRQRIERDENGRIPRGALLAALQQRDRLARSVVTTGLTKTAGLQNGWTFRGPANVGGRTRALLIDPRNPAHLWAGSVSGGLFSSQNGGKTWAPLNDFFPSLTVGSLAADPDDFNTFYVGTGEGFFNGDALNGLGIFVTHDGGASFQQLSATANWSAVNRIAVSPAEPSILLASTSNGIYRSSDGGDTWSSRTLYRSLQVAFNPRVPNEALASEEGINHVHQILFSEDGGNTWTSASKLNDAPDYLARIEIAYASDGSTVYANQDGDIWKSTDGGRSWDQVGQSNEGNWYSNALWVSPTDPNLVLAGGYEVSRSVNGGRSFAPISNGYLLTQQVHPDVHFIGGDPGYNGKTNRRVYVGCDGGVFVTDNVQTVTPRKGWRSLNSGYATTQYYSGAGDGPTALLLGGLQDNGTLRLQKTATATLTYGGDGGFVALDRQAPTYVYGEYISLSNLFRSKDGGKHLEAFIDGGLPEKGQGNFIAPFVLDPTDGTRMLAGARQLWLSTNVRTARSPAWTSIKPAASSPSGVQNISAIAVSPADPNRIWVGHNDGQLYVTSDGRSPSPSWQTVDDNSGIHNPLPNRYLTRVVASWQDPQVAWVSFGGRTPGNLWRTDDGGQTWHSISGQLPQIPIMSIAQHPTHPDWLYVGTEVGVFASEDGGESWGTVNEGPGNVEVDDITFLNRSTTLLAATHGRGLWTINVP